MLTKLYIRNFAIIKEVEVDFQSSLNVITGETGAGKSILMGALSLILGERAQSSAVNDDKCVVEASFLLEDSTIQSFLKENDIDEDSTLLIRREIATNGKSRAFVNDTPVSLAILKSLGKLLVDQHQQFDGQEVGDEHFQRSLIDALAGHADLLLKLKQTYFQLQELRRQFETLEAEQLQAEKDKDYHTFLFEELNALNLQPNELEDIAQELQQLEHANEITSTLMQVTNMMQEGESPILAQVKSMIQKLQSLSNKLSVVEEWAQRLKSVSIELGDIADEIDRAANNVRLDPERAATLREKLDEGYRLMKKHQVQDTEGLMRIKEELDNKLLKYDQHQHSLDGLQKQIDLLEKEALVMAEKISKGRTKVLPHFEKDVNALLHRVGMPHARVKVEMEQGNLQQHGLNRINILFNANVTGDGKDDVRFEPLGKVASGGELSRLMLCMKSLVAGKLKLPTLVFDEIDSGINGEAARQVAILMKEMAKTHQIISITHQPQIAAKANAHYYVFKQVKGNAIETAIKLLDPKERVDVIAGMLGGDKPSAAAIANAKEMIEAATA